MADTRIRKLRRRMSGTAFPILALLVVFLSAIAFAATACGGGEEDSSTSTRAKDTDRDKIPDRRDKCPKEKEDGGKWSGDAKDGCPDTIQDLIELGRREIDTFWRETFEADKVDYEGPHMFVGYRKKGLRTDCGEAELNNAFFCGADHSIYYDINFFQKELDTNGDYAPVFILAHEWGHLVQDLLDILYDENRYSIQNELQADCLAGVFTKHAEDIGLLEDKDFDEAVIALFRVGDSDDTPFFDPQAHGTSGQRIDAFNKGFNKGTGACLRDF